MVFRSRHHSTAEIGLQELNQAFLLSYFQEQGEEIKTEYYDLKNWTHKVFLSSGSNYLSFLALSLPEFPFFLSPLPPSPLWPLNSPEVRTWHLAITAVPFFNPLHFDRSCSHRPAEHGLIRRSKRTLLSPHRQTCLAHQENISGPVAVFLAWWLHP